MAEGNIEGQHVPVVLFPRFTSLVGQALFYGFAIDVSEYAAAELSLWRGLLIDPGGGVPTFKFYFQESTDRDSWQACYGTSSGYDPGDDTEIAASFKFRKRWFRAYVNLQGTNPSVTCWAQGFFIRRES
jgi:hypothetical protein